MIFSQEIDIILHLFHRQYTLTCITWTELFELIYTLNSILLKFLNKKFKILNLLILLNRILIFIDDIMNKFIFCIIWLKLFYEIQNRLG